jgi:hypothetical protein
MIAGCQVWKWEVPRPAFSCDATGRKIAALDDETATATALESAASSEKRTWTRGFNSCNSTLMVFKLPALLRTFNMHPSYELNLKI